MEGAREGERNMVACASCGQAILGPRAKWQNLREWICTRCANTYSEEEISERVKTRKVEMVGEEEHRTGTGTQMRVCAQVELLLRSDVELACNPEKLLEDLEDALLRLRGGVVPVRVSGGRKEKTKIAEVKAAVSLVKDV
jgi:DNA-directed RNA polymerase subunit M/transcription elongation factor TFIIS